MQLEVTAEQLELIINALEMYLKVFQTFQQRGEHEEQTRMQRVYELMSELELLTIQR